MKGICFIEPIFHKVVGGQVAQFRELMKVDLSAYDFHHYTDNKQLREVSWATFVANNPDDDEVVYGDKREVLHTSSRFFAGETVYLKEPIRIVKETRFFFTVKYTDGEEKQHERTDGGGNFGCAANRVKRMKMCKNGFCNKLFMPKLFSRYHIEITGVRAERLQDISDEDCLKEGIFEDPFNYEGCIDYCNGLVVKGGIKSFRSPREAYADLIDKISGKGTWESNPFVWVYDFKLINFKLTK